jgi:hypothetical protein
MNQLLKALPKWAKPGGLDEPLLELATQDRGVYAFREQGAAELVKLRAVTASGVAIRAEAIEKAAAAVASVETELQRLHAKRAEAEGALRDFLLPRERREAELVRSLCSTADPRLPPFLEALGRIANHMLTHEPQPFDADIVRSDDRGEIRGDDGPTRGAALRARERLQLSEPIKAFTAKLQVAMQRVRDLQLEAAPDVGRELAELIERLGPAPCKCAPRLAEAPTSEEAAA